MQADDGFEVTIKERIARQAGLDAGQMRRFDELEPAQRSEVEWMWGVAGAGDYLYALKKEPTRGATVLVARRWRMG